MFGTINDKQNITDSKYGTLFNNPKFIAISSSINEEALFILIKKYYDNKNKKELLECYDAYHKYEYKKYLDIINKYIDEYK